MKLTPLSCEGLFLVEPQVFGDERGFFKETYSVKAFADAGVRELFVQDNVSRSSKGVLRGLHLQNPHAQGKLVSVLEGEVYDVAVDVRKGSPTFGQWEGVVLSAENHRQLYVPPGYAHGFLTLSESALFVYKCTDLYSPSSELTIAWDDPTLAVEWPEVEHLNISAKDSAGQSLDDVMDALTEFST